MQVNVKNIEYLIETINILSKFSEAIEFIVNEKFNKIIRFLDEIIQELNLSNYFLSVAKTQETQKFAILTQKEVELESALQREAAALASGNPNAIASSGTYLAQKSHEVYIANQNYQKAKENRINMGKRVEFVSKAKAQNERLLDETKNIFKANISNIYNLKNQMTIRLQNAYKELNEYLTLNNADYAELDDLYYITKINEKNRIAKQSTYGVDVNEYISTTKELDIYQSKNLIEGEINGKKILIDNQIDFHQVDAKGRTNLERINKGLAPLDEDGEPYNLHHIGQKVDSPLAELRNNVHKQNDAILHDKSVPTEVHGGSVNWDAERANHWKKRAEQIKQDAGEEDV